MLFLGKKGWPADMLPSSVKLLILCAVGICLGSRSGDRRTSKSGRNRGKTEPRPRANIRVDSNLVLIPVTVTDPLNRFVTGWKRRTSSCWKTSCRRRSRNSPARTRRSPSGVVFDCSGSMGHKLDKSRQAVAQFFKLANPEDEFFLVQFNDSANLIQPFTRNLEEIQNKLAFTQSKGRTALLDAVYMALHEMKKAKNPRKALLLISDGGDNSSRYSESEIRALVKEADVQIYAIGIYESAGGRGRTPEESAGPAMLTEIAEQTGGRQYQVDNLNELPDVAAKIGVELRNQYILGYSPRT